MPLGSAGDLISSFKETFCRVEIILLLTGEMISCGRERVVLLNVWPVQFSGVIQLRFSPRSS